MNGNMAPLGGKYEKTLMCATLVREIGRQSIHTACTIILNSHNQEFPSEDAAAFRRAGSE